MPSETTASRAAMPIAFGRPTTAGLALLLHTAAGDYIRKHEALPPPPAPPVAEARPLACRQWCKQWAKTDAAWACTSDDCAGCGEHEGCFRPPPPPLPPYAPPLPPSPPAPRAAGGETSCWRDEPLWPLVADLDEHDRPVSRLRRRRYNCERAEGEQKRDYRHRGQDAENVCVPAQWPREPREEETCSHLLFERASIGEASL